MIFFLDGNLKLMVVLDVSTTPVGIRTNTQFVLVIGVWIMNENGKMS